MRPVGRDRDQPLGELDRGLMGEAEHRRVRDALELRVDRRVDRRMPVPVDVAPERGDAVDVRVAVGVVEVGALGVIDDHDRLVLAPSSLLRERMPDVTSVGGEELGGVTHETTS